MRSIKKFFIILLVFVMIFTYCPTTYAANISDDSRVERIRDILSQFMEYNMMKVRNGTQTAKMDSVEQNLISQLELLDVEIMDSNEAMAFMSGKGVSPLFLDPPDTTDDVLWATFFEIDVVDGEIYEVQHITATARTTNTNLAFSDASHEIYENKSFSLSDIDPVVAIYIQKGIGQIPVIGWLPYEFFFAQPDVSTSANATYTGLTTAAFSFVKINGQDDYYLTLSLSSNSLVFDGAIAVTGARDGVPYTETQDFEFESESDNFCDTLTAIEAYKNHTHATSFISAVPMEFAVLNGEPQCEVNLSVPTMYYMGQVF